ncbi:uncharacterized protein EV420DRAFT_1743897, partial [Desarmillaria tabescens]
MSTFYVATEVLDASGPVIICVPRQRSSPDLIYKWPLLLGLGIQEEYEALRRKTCMLHSPSRRRKEVAYEWHTRIPSSRILSTYSLAAHRSGDVDDFLDTAELAVEVMSHTYLFILFLHRAPNYLNAPSRVDAIEFHVGNSVSMTMLGWYQQEYYGSHTHLKCLPEYYRGRTPQYKLKHGEENVRALFDLTSMVQIYYFDYERSSCVDFTAHRLPAPLRNSGRPSYLLFSLVVDSGPSRFCDDFLLFNIASDQRMPSGYGKSQQASVCIRSIREIQARWHAIRAKKRLSEVTEASDASTEF